jgi:hypothetical protein
LSVFSTSTAVHVLHVEVEQDHVRLQAARELDAFLAAGSLADELEFGCGLDQLDHALAKQRMVVDDEDGLGV